jgi:hypothetical protein
LLLLYLLYLLCLDGFIYGWFLLSLISGDRFAPVILNLCLAPVLFLAVVNLHRFIRSPTLMDDDHRQRKLALCRGDEQLRCVSGATAGTGWYSPFLIALIIVVKSS